MSLNQCSSLPTKRTVQMSFQNPVKHLFNPFIAIFAKCSIFKDRKEAMSGNFSLSVFLMYETFQSGARKVLVFGQRKTILFC